MEEKSKAQLLKEKLFARSQKAENLSSLRKAPVVGTRNRVIIRSTKRRRKKPEIFNHEITYDFLQYVRIVFKWATTTHGISRKDLDLFLYLYPIGLFGQSEFHFMYRTIGMYGRGAFKGYLENGWIVPWREGRAKSERKLYKLSQKGKLLCTRVHNMCVGEEPIPETRRNALVTDKSVYVNNIYMQVIKKMNQNNAEKEKARTQE